ncbi:MAG: hypothetical protein QI223_00595 [Candidatus Korarchaeota archaeon]|nr:hypothetical protein [Candidatus Korarchaeota archaeon]
MSESSRGKEVLMSYKRELAVILVVLVLAAMWLHSAFSVHYNLRLVSAQPYVSGNFTGLALNFTLRNDGFYPLFVSAGMSLKDPETGEVIENFSASLGLVKGRSDSYRILLLPLPPQTIEHLPPKLEVDMVGYYEAKLFWLPGIRVPLHKEFIAPVLNETWRG